MKTQDIVFKIEHHQELNAEDKTFIKNMWDSDSVVKDEKYKSNRCPKCNIPILYNGHYCYQCGKKIVMHW